MPRDDVSDHSRPGWRSRDILKAAAIVLAVWILLQKAWIIRNVLLIAFLGALLGIVIAAATDRLERWRIPRSVGATGLLLLSIGSLVALIVAAGPTITRQFGELRSRLPQVLDQVEERIGISPAVLGREILEQIPQPEGSAGAPPPEGEPEEKSPEGTVVHSRSTERTVPSESKAGGGGALRRALSSNFGAFRQILFPVATATASFVGAIVIILFVALFVAISPRLYREGFLRLLPPSRRDHGRDVLRELSATLRQWALARLTAMVVVGVVVGVSLGVIGVRAAILLGVIAGLLELIPFFGPIASAIPAIGMALLDSPRQAVIVAILFLVVQQLEGNLLTPLLLERRVDVPPLLTVIVVPAMTVVLGVIGALVAEPLIAMVMLLVRRLWVEDYLESSR
jgi:predicted PurR-regulated permease PerM